MNRAVPMQHTFKTCSILSPLKPHSSLYAAGKFAVPTRIFTISFGLSPLCLSTRTSPVFSLPFDTPFGSTLGLLKGRSSSLAWSFLFLLPSAIKRARSRGARRSLTILVLLGLDGLGVAGLGVDAADDVAAGVGRGAGVLPGRGEGAALGRGEGTDVVFVLILSLGAGRGIGEATAEGVVTDEALLTVPGIGLAAATGGGTGTAAAAAAVAGFAFSLGGAAGCMSGISGVEARDSVLMSSGGGAGDACTDGCTGKGET